MDAGFWGWIFVGLIAGALAKWIVPGREPGGLLVTMVIGILGGLIGGWLSVNVLHLGPTRGLSFGSIAVATLGAVILLAIYHAVRNNRRSV